MNEALLNRIGHLTQVELYDELYRDSLTGCLNRRAFMLQNEMGVNARFLAIVDLDSLKWINDNISHEEGSNQLHKLGAELLYNFGEDEVYRLGGDEFAVTSNHVVDLQAKLMILQSRLPFTFGLGISLPCADLHLKVMKQIRTAKGLRAARGERPPWVAAIREVV